MVENLYGYVVTSNSRSRPPFVCTGYSDWDDIIWAVAMPIDFDMKTVGSISRK